MGEQRNLTEESVEELKAQLVRMQQGSFGPNDGKYDEPDGDAPDTITIVKEIQRKIESLEHKIDLIFGGHVLLNGKFKKI